MKLFKVTIYKYKSFLTEQSVDIEPDITRIVGKNESGKSALLEALAKSRYYEERDDSFKFNFNLDYPRSQLIKAKQEQEKPNAVECFYTLNDEEIAAVEKEFAVGILKTRSFSLLTSYDGSQKLKGLETDFDIAKKWLLDTHGSGAVAEACVSCTDLESLWTIANEHKNEADWISLFTELSKYKNGTMMCTDLIAGYIFHTYILPKVPRFWYFSEYYSILPQVNLSSYESWLKNGRSSSVHDAGAYGVVSALFELSGLTVDMLKNETDFEIYTANLEATSNAITDEMFKYWNTNKNLEIKFSIKHEGYLSLVIRVYNSIHRVSLPLQNRSKGFLWFFSFLVWFNKLQGDKNADYILLLDEPGLSLHASAQKDLLRFIEERLAPNYQVIYTTHSPFMIDSLRLDQVRTVFDTQNPDVGSVVSSALEEKDSDTLFPLQAALGYTLAQNLFVSEYNLLVEGISDFVYLSHFSSILNEMGREGLNEDITIVPVGGADKVATFISLMRGNELNCVCLLDTMNEQKAKDRLQKMVEQKLIADKKILFADSFVGGFKSADIEDFFDQKDYLSLYNGAFASEIKEEQLDKTKGILSQLKRLRGGKDFNHYSPANYMMANIGTLKFDDKTLNTFESVFKKINSLLM